MVQGVVGVLQDPSHQTPDQQPSRARVDIVCHTNLRHASCSIRSASNEHSGKTRKFQTIVLYGEVTGRSCGKGAILPILHERAPYMPGVVYGDSAQEASLKKAMMSGVNNDDGAAYSPPVPFSSFRANEVAQSPSRVLHLLPTSGFSRRV